MGKPVDIEDFAQAVKSSLLKYLLQAVMALPDVKAIRAIPVVGVLFEKLVEWIINLLLGKVGLAAFIINTKVFTQAQAEEYIKAIGKLKALPDNVSDEEWAKHEEIANEAFKNLIRHTV